jgi:hypothetical protein
MARLKRIPCQLVSYKVVGLFHIYWRSVHPRYKRLKYVVFSESGDLVDAFRTSRQAENFCSNL